MCHLRAPVFFAALTEFLAEFSLFASFIAFLRQIVVIWLKLFLLSIFVSKSFAFAFLLFCSFYNSANSANAIGMKFVVK